MNNLLMLYSAVAVVVIMVLLCAARSKVEVFYSFAAAVFWPVVAVYAVHRWWKSLPDMAE